MGPRFSQENGGKGEDEHNFKLLTTEDRVAAVTKTRMGASGGRQCWANSSETYPPRP
jgi:hypothetical protein